MHWEIEGFPEEVKLCPYNEYDFEMCRPEMVIYQFPYDEYSYALSLYPYFYSSAIRKFAKKMVFIPSFVLREIGEQDEISRYTLRWYLHTPGICCADKIIVQSENMKQIFIELLSEVVTNSGTMNWSERVTCAGSAIWDWERRKRQDDCANKAKKVLLYYVSGSVLYEKKEAMIKKIKCFMKIIEKYKDDMTVIWCQDTYSEEILKRRVPDVWEQYKELVNNFEKETDGRIDYDSDYSKLAWNCDAIYGDGGVLMTKCREEHKLVLFETPEVPVEQPEGYVEKTWEDDIMVAVEGEWSLENILREMQRYEYKEPMSDCGKRIWDMIK